jgi:hypothetical protein
MKQASLKIKSYTSNVNIVDNSNLQRRILNIMLSMLGVLALSYFLLLGSMVFNIVERKSLEKHAYTLTNEVGDLELSYFDLSHQIDLDLAYSLGFKEIKTKFATRKTLGSINIAKNEI